LAVVQHLRSAEGTLLSIAGRSEEALQATREMILARGASVVRIIACDLSQAAGIDTAAAAIAQAEQPVDVFDQQCRRRPSLRGIVPSLDKSAFGLGRRLGSLETFTQSVCDAPALPGLSILKVVDCMCAPFSTGNRAQHPLSRIA
jgi:NAD(P)-dependent dehydrogenase (short-subunit alcohol dehydrogenase family)